MRHIVHNQALHLLLLGVACGLSISVGVIFYFNAQSTEVFDSVSTQVATQDTYSILAAVNGSYSTHQPHSHSLFTPKSSRGAVAYPQFSSTTQTILFATSTPAPVPTPTPTPVAVAPQPQESIAATPAAVSTSSAVVVGMGTAPPAPAGSPTPSGSAPSSRFGISVGATLSWLSDQDLNAELDDMVSLGVSWVRYDFEWDQIQAGGSDSYDWAPTDRVVKAVLAHHLKLLPIIAYSPAWARPAGCDSYMCGPADPATYAAFAKAVVARYASQGLHTWEIWNEPNIKQFWQPEPNAANYAALLKDAYVAIKTQDPSAFVVSAGLSPAASVNGNIAPLDFVSQLYQDGAGKYFDALGFHPYSYPALPSYSAQWNAWGQMASTPTNLRSIMSANGDSTKQIWITEFGAPTGGPGAGATVADSNFANSPDHVDEVLQAAMLNDAFQQWQGASWGGPMFWYSYKDIGTTNNTNENFFGLLRYDGTHKPAYDVLKQLLLAGH